MDGIVLLKEDHKTVKRLFREFEKTHKDATPAAKRALVETIVKELTTHAYIEENDLLSGRAPGVPETTDHVLESVEEHHVVRGCCRN
jgi:hemerythrin superfamily protein